MPETNNAGYIIAAYAITWVVLIGYSVHLVRTIKRAVSQYEQKHKESGRAG